MSSAYVPMQAPEGQIATEILARAHLSVRASVSRSVSGSCAAVLMPLAVFDEDCIECLFVRMQASEVWRLQLRKEHAACIDRS